MSVSCISYTKEPKVVGQVPSVCRGGHWSGRLTPLLVVLGWRHQCVNGTKTVKCFRPKGG